MILSIRTDKPEAEIGLFDGQKKLSYLSWEAHRELSATIHHKIDQLLANQNLTMQDLSGIVAFQGPGSFTGLRIGISVANALAHGLNLPIASARGENWISQSIESLQDHKDEKVVAVHYGEPAKTTKPKK